MARIEVLARATPALLLSDQPTAYRLISYASIEALGAWATFVREYLLACLIDCAYRSGGIAVTHSLVGQVGTEEAALIAAIRAGKNPQFVMRAGRTITPFDEPNWKKPNVILRIAAGLQFSNHAEIVNALSLQTASLTDFVTVRNFFAHKSKESENEVSNIARATYLQGNIDHPARLIGEILPNRSDTLLSEWLAELRHISLRFAM